MAFGSLNDKSDAPMAEINVTPLVDVMLVLLIVFMITMPVMTHSLSLQLPENKATPSPKVEDPIRLEVNAQGQYLLNQQPISGSELVNRLTQEDPKETTLAIAADKNVSYDFVAQAISAARQAGITKIGLVNADAP